MKCSDNQCDSCRKMSNARCTTLRKFPRKHCVQCVAGKKGTRCITCSDELAKPPLPPKGCDRCAPLKKCRDDASINGCCARRILSLQRDFFQQKGKLQEKLESRSHIVLFYSKFHCELKLLWRGLLLGRLRRRRELRGTGACCTGASGAGGTVLGGTVTPAGGAVINGGPACAVTFPRRLQTRRIASISTFSSSPTSLSIASSPKALQQLSALNFKEVNINCPLHRLRRLLFQQRSRPRFGPFDEDILYHCIAPAELFQVRICLNSIENPANSAPSVSRETSFSSLTRPPAYSVRSPSPPPSCAPWGSV